MASANTGARWSRVKGKAFQLAIGANGQVWALGDASIPGGFPVYRLDEGNWTRVTGALTSLAVDGKGQAWGANENKNMYRYTGQSWTKLPGRAEQVAIGGKGTVFALGARGEGRSDQADTDVYEWGGGKWTKIGGAQGARLAVDERDLPWLLKAGGDMVRHNGSSWQKVPGTASDISIGSDGSVWAIGVDARGDKGFGIYRFNGKGWVRVDGAAQSVAVGPNGMPWVVDTEGAIYERL